MPVLFCRHLDRRTEWKVVVDDSDFTIGFSESATIPLPDETLAPREVRITRKGERYLLQDLAEKGRVILGGTVTRTGLLKDGDCFRLGRVSVLFHDQDQRTGGQVEVFRDPPPSFDLLESASQSSVVKRSEPLTPDDPEIPRGVWAAVLVLAVFSGLSLGILLWGPPRDTTAAVERATTSMEAPGTLPKSGEQAIARVKEEARSPVSSLPNRRTPTTEPAVPKASPPPQFALEPILEPAAGRLSLFRLFIDLAGRPPTRAEERELLSLNHEAKWQEALDTGRREGTLPQLTTPLEAQFLDFIGRQPSGVEVQEITGAVTQERPAAFWITALPEYRRVDHRRQRSDSVRARSLIVDFLDRAPSSEKEAETVRAALPQEGTAMEVARALVYSASGRQKALAERETTWEAEAFRFLLREPTSAERTELGAAWERLDPAERRIWLLLALATHEDYGKY